MKIRNLHEWDVPPSRAVEIQQSLRQKISLQDTLDFRRVRFIAGADVSYDKGDTTLYGAVVLVKLPEMEIAEQRWAKETVTFPYIPGLLSFREAPILLKAFSLLKRSPEAVIFDGQGIAHPRRFGLGSHVGLFLDLPSVGCAKTRLVGEHGRVGIKKGSFVWLTYQGKRVGAVVRTRTNVRPVFVSPGHRISIRAAMKLVLSTCRRYRLPEPVRLAHQLVNRVRLEARRGSPLPPSFYNGS